MSFLTLFIPETISILNLIYDIYNYVRVAKYIKLSSEHEKCGFLKITYNNGIYNSKCINPSASKKFLRNGKLCPNKCHSKVGTEFISSNLDVIKLYSPITPIRLVSESIAVLVLAIAIFLQFV